jgi:hypothetical protein
MDSSRTANAVQGKTSEGSNPSSSAIPQWMWGAVHEIDTRFGGDCPAVSSIIDVLKR